MVVVVASITLEEAASLMVAAEAALEEVAMTSSNLEEVEVGGKLTTTLTTACICARHCQRTK